MSLFQCEECGCCENTALSNFWMKEIPEWGGTGRALCSACDPEIGEWHDEFPRTFLPKGKFKTNGRGNLQHIETGSEDFRQYAIKESESDTQ